MARTLDQDRSEPKPPATRHHSQPLATDVPMSPTVKPGGDFIIEVHGLGRRQIENNDSADDVRDVDLSKGAIYSRPGRREAPSRRPEWWWIILDIAALRRTQIGVSRVLPRKNGGGLPHRAISRSPQDHWEFQRHLHVKSGISPARIYRPEAPRPDRLPAIARSCWTSEQA